MLSTTKLLTAIERKLTTMPDVMYEVHTDSQRGNTMIFINTEYYIDLRWNNATLYKKRNTYIPEKEKENITLDDCLELYLADVPCLQVELLKTDKDEEYIAEQFCEKIRQLIYATTLNELY